MPWIILSPCGTSLLTNALSGSEAPDLRSKIFRYANARTETEVPVDDRALISERIERVRSEMREASTSDVVRRSAELNAIVTLYAERGRSLGAGGDLHWIVCTDTWLGEATAEIVAEWLGREGFSVEVHRQRDLQTQSLDGFQVALSELAAWCYERLPAPGNPGTEIFFNLTGGFKGVNGFLQTLGMFRADEVVYIFEGQKQLMSIPRLPIRVTAADVIEKNLAAFRRMALKREVRGIGAAVPSSMVLQQDDVFTLSAWGEIQWNEVRRELYSATLLESPDESVAFAESFRRDAAAYVNRSFEINDQIDKLVGYFASNRQKHLASLGFECVLKAAGTFEFKAWDDGKAYRCFGRFKGDVFIVENLAPGLH